MGNNLLRYSAAASEWKEGLPIGNGRIGAIVCGDTAEERFALNHEWLYRGRFRDRAIIPPPAGALAEVRRLIDERRFIEAAALANDAFAPTGGTLASSLPPRVDPYQPAGDLIIDYGAPAESYERSLDIASALHTVRRRQNGASTVQRSFTAYPAGALFIELASASGLDALVSLSRTEDAGCALTYDVSPSGITMRGVFDGGIKFTVALRVYGCEASVEGGGLRLSGSRAVVGLNIGTSSQGLDPDAEAALPDSVDFERLLAAHSAAFGKYYGACELTLDVPEPAVTTDRRLADFKAGGDPSLALLYFNFGRYLFICSSGSLPPQLQGIWNDKIAPPWECDFHNDVNLQMNHWMCEATGLGELCEPLFAFCERLVPSARKAAEQLYGCRGICFPIQTDAWSISTPESHGWAVWTGAAAWLALHFWQHYEYTGDEEFLRARAYPFLREAAEFYESYLYRDGEGKLVFAPSQSPENVFVGGASPVSICKNCALDLELAAETFRAASDAAFILRLDHDRYRRWRELLADLPKLQVGSRGQLLEWGEEFEEAEPGHRHVSHLWGVYPAQTITKADTPKLFAAAKRTLELRLAHGGGHTGWSRSWTSCLCAVFGDAEAAYAHLTALICDFATVSLLDLHPPRIFQIDGNFGGAAAVCEMLLHSSDRGVVLLPALPDKWRAGGSARGLRARGGLTLSFAWRGGEIVSLSVSSERGGEFVLADGSAPLAPNLAEALSVPLVLAAGETKEFN